MSFSRIAFSFSLGGFSFRFCARTFIFASVLLFFLLLLSLGFWQVSRLSWKQDLQELRESRSELPAIDYTSGGIAFVSGDAFTRVRVSGRYDFLSEQFLLRRHVDGRPGWHVITPFILSGGGAVLVNRGWVDFDHRARDSRPESVEEGDVFIEGLLRFPKLRGGWLLPEDSAAERSWYREDLAAMARAIVATGFVDGDVDGDVETGWLIVADTNTWGDFPQGRQWSSSLRNAHASYALTWFLLGLCLLGVFFSANTEIEKL